MAVAECRCCVYGFYRSIGTKNDDVDEMYIMMMFRDSFPAPTLFSSLADSL